MEGWGGEASVFSSLLPPYEPLVMQILILHAPSHNFLTKRVCLHCTLVIHIIVTNSSYCDATQRHWACVLPNVG